jgi:hypothetical protein
MVVLIGATAITIDYGSWLKARRDYQNFADASALHGAAFLTRPISPAKRIAARQAAWQSLKDQMDLGIDPVALSATDTAAGAYVEDSGYRMWVSTPPIGATTRYPGTSTGPDDRTVFVSLERENDSFFSRVFGQGARTVSAWATAGTLPNRFAVITLRRPGQSGDTATDIDINGNGTSLRVQDGDVGGIWGMAINGVGARMIIESTPGSGTFGLFLTESTPTGGNGWQPTQLVDGSGNPIPANPYPGVPDPDYPLPTAIANAPAGPTAGVPLGDLAGDVDVRSSGPAAGQAPGGTIFDAASGVLSCDPASPRIGPGYYTDIDVENGKCLILDPVSRHSSVSVGTPDVATPLPAAQQPGIFYINGSIDVAGRGMIVGNGVTVVIRPHPTNNNQNQLNLSGGSNSPAVMTLNSSQRLGGWYIRKGEGFSPYSCTAGVCTYDSSLESDIENVGMALYIVKRSQYNSSVAVDNNSAVVKVNASSALAWQGLTYAAHDNVSLAGQPGHAAVGQLVCWTFKFAGATQVTQTYAGPESGLPYLIEPRVGQ